MNFDKDLDARGLNCPLPILRTKKALADMTTGQVLRIVATDPGSVKDFQAFSKQTGNQLLEHGEANREFTFFMQKKVVISRLTPTDNCRDSSGHCVPLNRDGAARVALGGLALALTAALLGGCGKAKEPPPDILKSQREQMDKARDVGNTLQQGADRARDADK